MSYMQAQAEHFCCGHYLGYARECPTCRIACACAACKAEKPAAERRGIGVAFCPACGAKAIEEIACGLRVICCGCVGDDVMLVGPAALVRISKEPVEVLDDEGSG